MLTYADSFTSRQTLHIPLEKIFLLIGGREPPVSREQVPADSGGLYSIRLTAGVGMRADQDRCQLTHHIPGKPLVLRTGCARTLGGLTRLSPSLTFCDRQHSGKRECRVPKESPAGLSQTWRHGQDGRL